MKVHIAAFIMCFAAAVPTLAQTDEYFDKLCTDLREEVLQYLAPFQPSGLHLYDGESPLMKAMDSTTAGLEGEPSERIRTPLTDLIVSACINPNTHTKDLLKNHGLQENPTFGQAMNAILDFLELDPSKPRWGLIDLPETDFSKMTMDEVMLSFDHLPLTFVNGNPVNDVPGLALRKYWSAYNLSTQDSLDKVQKIMASLTFGIEDSETETMKNILDRLAAAEGLELKKK